MDDSGQYRDSSGKRLIDYPRPSVAVDTAVLTLDDAGSALLVLQVRRDNDAGWGLPGTFLHEGERLAEAVNRSLQAKAGVRGLRPRQLQVFDDPNRDSRGWVLSVAHLVVARADRLATRYAETTRLVPVAGRERLSHDHSTIISAAVQNLRTRYAGAPDPDRFLPAEFTIAELHRAHEAVAGHELQRDTFRRNMNQQLVATGRMVVTGGRGRPAELFRRAA